uniref:Uncharacterized protein n=1 Tax=Myripristis murdjan TaxID=586833 RepID=A0A668AAX1_9TELE
MSCVKILHMTKKRLNPSSRFPPTHSLKHTPGDSTRKRAKARERDRVKEVGMESEMNHPFNEFLCCPVWLANE